MLEEAFLTPHLELETLVDCSTNNSSSNNRLGWEVACSLSKMLVVQGAFLLEVISSPSVKLKICILYYRRAEWSWQHSC